MRTKDPDPPARNKLLDAAEEIMLAKGFVASTVDEICTGASVTKGSFFHYFENKEEMARVLLERFANRQRDRFMASCAAIEDPLARVYCIIDCAIGGFQDPEMKGCLVGTFAQEISETHPGLREVCQCSFEGFSAGLSRDLVDAKKRHAPDSDFDAESLGNYVLSLVQGSMLIHKSTGDRNAMVGNLQHLKSYFNSLYGR